MKTLSSINPDTNLKYIAAILTENQELAERQGRFADASECALALTHLSLTREAIADLKKIAQDNVVAKLEADPLPASAESIEERVVNMLAATA